MLVFTNMVKNYYVKNDNKTSSWIVLHIYIKEKIAYIFLCLVP